MFHLERELLRERMRSSVLEEQLKPINIHRWRRLEVKDLSTIRSTFVLHKLSSL